MSKYGCDHEFVIIKKIDKTTLTNKINITEGQLLICHYCGTKKEVYEDGTIITDRK